MTDGANGVRRCTRFCEIWAEHRVMIKRCGDHSRDILPTQKRQVSVDEEQSSAPVLAATISYAAIDRALAFSFLHIPAAPRERLRVHPSPQTTCTASISGAHETREHICAIASTRSSVVTQHSDKRRLLCESVFSATTLQWHFTNPNNQSPNAARPGSDITVDVVRMSIPSARKSSAAC